MQPASRVLDVAPMVLVLNAMARCWQSGAANKPPLSVA
jgi:hypothetical protein